MRSTEDTRDLEEASRETEKAYTPRNFEGNPPYICGKASSHSEDQVNNELQVKRRPS